MELLIEFVEQYINFKQIMYEMFKIFDTKHKI